MSLDKSIGISSNQHSSGKPKKKKVTHISFLKLIYFIPASIGWQGKFLKGEIIKIHPSFLSIFKLEYFDLINSYFSIDIIGIIALMKMLVQGSGH
jgi:hypothetical protein